MAPPTLVWSSRPTLSWQDYALRIGSPLGALTAGPRWVVSAGCGASQKEATVPARRPYNTRPAAEVPNSASSCRLVSPNVAGLIIEALAAALLTRRPPAGVIFHGDRGCQYTSKEFADFCTINGVRRSMGRRATCYDNAVTESFFATYKKELIHTRPWNDRAEVQQHTFLWIEGYYNRRRRHSTLNYLTPLEYELGYRKLTDLAA